MKKMLLVAGILASSVAMAKGNTVEVKLGLDASNKVKVKDSGVNEYYGNILKRGAKLEVEYRKEIIDNFEIGAGIGYSRAEVKKDELLEKDLKNISKNNPNKIVGEVSSNDFKSIPVYAVAQYNFKNNSEVTPYVKGKLGFALNSGEIEEMLQETSSLNTVFNYHDKTKIKNGYYMGVGAGVNVKNIIVDLSYNLNMAKIKYDYTYKRDGLVRENSSETFKLKKSYSNSKCRICL